MLVEAVTGALLVLLTWAVVVGAVTGAGLFPALRLGPRADHWTTMRMALWWGVAIATVVVVAVGLVTPLASPTAAGLVIGLLALMTTLGAWVWKSRGRSPHRQRPSDARRWSWILGAGLATACLYLALAAMGPVTNYDTGLYHLGAISYASDFRTIPGLANLYFPFGYANAEFPVAAFLGNGPWDGEGYRLLNGGLITAASWDLWCRARSRQLGPGFFVLAVGMTALLVPMVALSDYWVTSPTSDSAVLVLSIVSVSYLVDAVARPRKLRPQGSVAVVTVVLTVMLRPTMAVLALGTVAVVLLLVIRARRRGSADAGLGWLVWSGGLALLAATVMSARDLLLSGWLQYPLSLIAVDVPWRAADPTQFRTPTLGAARDPENLWEAAENWEWIVPWFQRVPSQWETYLLASLVLTAGGLLLWARQHGAVLRPKALLLAMAPSLLTVVIWWLVTPPSFRFVWGPMFSLGAIPAGWALWRLSGLKAGQAITALRVTSLGLAVPVVATVIFSAAVRLDLPSMTQDRIWSLGVQIPYSVTPVVDAPVAPLTLSSGLTVLAPTESDQCWEVYPLCTAQLAESVSLRGSTLQEGFLP